MRHSDDLLRKQNQIRDSFLTVAPLQRNTQLPQDVVRVGNPPL